MDIIKEWERRIEWAMIKDEIELTNPNILVIKMEPDECYGGECIMITAKSKIDGSQMHMWHVQSLWHV